MKVGDLVKFDEWQYPQYKGKLGVLGPSRPELRWNGMWKVYIGGRFHPYMVDADCLTVIDEKPTTAAMFD